MNRPDPRHQNRARGDQPEADCHAPYNFVPVADWVYFPDWSRRVSHDLPFSDGIDGCLSFTLTAHSPLLVAAEQEGSDQRFVRAPDGRYFIPGSSLRGMLRNVLEIATFGKLSRIDDRHLGVRDLSGGLPAYTQAMTQPLGGAFAPKSRAGWLSFSGGQWRITPCQHSRVDYRDDLLPLLPDPARRGQYKNFMENRLDDEQRTARAKYAAWERQGGSLDVWFDPGPLEPHKHSPDRNGKPKMLRYSKALRLGGGATPGRLVLTGQPMPAGQPGRKHMEFLFHTPAASALPVTAGVMRGFLQVHAESADWDYWRQRQRRTGEAIPVFYLEESPGRIRYLGLAQMFKLPYRLSLHDALRQVSPAHLDTAPDFVETVFGRAADDNDATGLRGRVSVGHAWCDEAAPALAAAVTVILNEPKPSYYPHYVRQTTDSTGAQLANRTEGYRTLMDDQAPPRGWKRYPARRFRPPASVPASAVSVTLHPLERPTFTGKLRFHNLRPVELGAVVWAMTWGGRETLRHGLGMGRPLGYGQVSLSLQAAPGGLDYLPGSLQALDLDADPEPAPDALLDACQRAFVAHMETVHAEQGGLDGGWEAAPALQALRAMADPAEGARHTLRYMVLDHRNRRNDFLDAKKADRVLPDYVPYTPPARAAGQRAGGGSALSLDQLLDDVMGKIHIPREQALRGQPLAQAWAALEDGPAKAALRDAIEACWREQGWWDAPPGKAAKKAKALYDGAGG